MAIFHPIFYFSQGWSATVLDVRCVSKRTMRGVRKNEQALVELGNMTRHYGMKVNLSVCIYFDSFENASTSTPHWWLSAIWRDDAFRAKRPRVIHGIDGMNSNDELLVGCL
jgi:hypothetical protein